MDKIKVNNQVVSMRKFVKQAKIHTINKCTKQMKFLENRKGNEEQIAKTKRKLQRLLEEVTILKKIKPDSVSKLALSKAKDWKAILAEKNIPLEERCFAMLANHAPVQKCVEKFHNDNSELIPKIPELVKQWEEKKSKRSQMLKQKQNDVKNPNTVPIGNKNNFHKPGEILIDRQNSESLESLSDGCSDSKNFQKEISEQNLKSEKAVKRKVSLENTTDNLVSVSIPNSPDEKKFLANDDAESDDSDGSLSNNSDLAHHLSNQIKEKSPVKEKSNNDRSCMNSKKSETCVIDPESSLDQKKVLLKNNSKETIKKSDREENSEKMQGIRSKLLEISMSKTKAQIKPKSKSSTVLQQYNAKPSSDDEYKIVEKNANISHAKTKPPLPINPEVKNKIKAITMLDLNELQDIDEIPIEKSDSDVEDENNEDSGKQKKDPFFLRDGEPVSESDEDETTEKETMRSRDFPSFKKKPYGSFNKGEQRDSSFPKKKFEKHSMNGKNANFRENSLMKNKKESIFDGNKRNFKQAFGDNSEYRQNKNFKFSSKDKFNNRNGSNNFTKNPKEKTSSPNHNRESKWNSHSMKLNLSNSLQKNKPDDKPLHPSWEAKRKLKEAATLKFQGKRMVFND